MEKSGDDIQVEFPFIVATVPHRILTNYVPELIYGEHHILIIYFCVTC